MRAPAAALAHACPSRFERLTAEDTEQLRDRAGGGLAEHAHELFNGEGELRRIHSFRI